MKKSYKEIKSKDVLSELGTGTDVLIVDLDKKKVIDCKSLTVGQISVYIEDEGCVFYEAQ